ncbi:BPL-N domain-containing protein [Micromonospora sp. NPDC049460]|uniref:BPL-N domain-containing protein n=1 Tax=Micromonospora sp. NPDC049460 TaxID=3364272 RepID=UPI0037BBC03A
MGRTSSGLLRGETRRISRRRLVVGAGAAGTLAALGWAGVSAVTGEGNRPLALVYRGPAACSGCAEAVAALLRSAPGGFRTEYCGPGEQRQISRSTLGEATVYAQPGGGNVGPAWRRLRDHAEDIRGFVRDGGHYLGFCLGAYLAATRPGFGLLDGKVDQYIRTAGASVDSADDAVVPVRWRGRSRHMFFQDGPTLELRPGAPGIVLATYDTGAPAAVVTAFGAGRVGLVGPHPEADRSWYADAELTNPDGIRLDLGHDLVRSTVDGWAPASGGS